MEAFPKAPVEPEYCDGCPQFAQFYVWPMHRGVIGMVNRPYRTCWDHLSLAQMHCAEPLTISIKKLRELQSR